MSGTPGQESRAICGPVVKSKEEEAELAQRGQPSDRRQLTYLDTGSPQARAPLAAPLSLSFPSPHVTHHVSEHLGLSKQNSPSLFPPKAATASLPAYSNFLPASRPSRDSSLSGSCHT